jgi:hypothetical protein
MGKVQRCAQVEAAVGRRQLVEGISGRFGGGGRGCFGGHGLGVVMKVDRATRRATRSKSNNVAIAH